MLSKRHISATLLLLLVVLTVAAEDAFSQRGCRRGVVSAATRSNRAQRALQQAGGDFYVGDRRQLVVLVSFSDLQFADSDPIAAWSRIFNEPNLTDAPFHGSVYDYYYAQSGGQFRLTFDVLHVALGSAIERYRSTAWDDENSQYLVNDVVDALLARNVDWGQYDWNGDGYVNQLMLIYPGYGMNDGGGSNTIWPHQWWLSMHEKDGQTGVYCEPRRVTGGGRDYYVDCYCALQECANGRKYGSFGTICHEYTHCFGFPDFYNGGTKYVGAWDLMDSGNNNADGFCPPNYSAHERWLMGWLTPVELTATQTIGSMDGTQAYLVRNDGHADEYYIVENRQQTGWDSSLPGSGLVVFHVDYDEAVWLGVEGYANSQSLQRYTIVPANNRTTKPQGWAYPYQANDSLTNHSVPAATLNHANTDGTKLLGKSLRDIRVSGGLASFDFTAPRTTGIVEQSLCRPSETLYDLGPVVIIRNARGEVKKVLKHR